MATRETDDSYSGENSYKYVDKLIKGSSRELMIISPYISNYYTNMLLKQTGKKHIKVITSENSSGYKNSGLQKFISQGVKGYVKAILFFFILDLISVYLQFIYTTVIITLIIIALALFAYRKRENARSNMEVKVVKNKFVHEKLYITDEMAIVGSANLTYNGMHKNIEHIELIRDYEKIGRLREHFDTIWNNN